MKVKTIVTVAALAAGAYLLYKYMNKKSDKKDYSNACCGA